ncbi:uncharacterized protein N7477_009088 [Penicillium maclennaniae]|uniref:uncharacterized protein n=1 Tax=Penicillium maclennaniae TaxID=1343394 RepID=UPI002540D4E9|nr:uncharacterized protein N7477_009088 [Penicillium maclennaniae]KAJ5661472.1 hypothetical protein N7477_009088 [Penicillium maclennaniae]
MLTRPDELALMDPLTVDDVGDLMDEMEQRDSPRAIVPISQDSTLVVSRLSKSTVTAPIMEIYKPKPPKLSNPATTIPVKEQDQPQLATPLKRRLRTTITDDLPPNEQTCPGATTPTKHARQETPATSPGSEHKRRKGIPIPQSWELATAEDILLFKLKEYGGTWAEITAEWNNISGLRYASSTISNRWTKIHSTLGDPPERIWDLDSSMSS